MAEPLDREMPIAAIAPNPAATGIADGADANGSASHAIVAPGIELTAAAVTAATVVTDREKSRGDALTAKAVWFLPILLVLNMLGFTNLFLRSSFGVMAPSLAREMSLTPAMLSTIASSFFFAYALMQVPTGMLLDRFGARRTLSALMLFTTLGAALFAFGTTPGMLSAGRVLMGIGCAGVFTGAFYVLAVYEPADRLVTRTSTLNGFASLGNLCATAPFAALIAWIGWRYSYWAFTVAVGLLTLAVVLVMRDGPPGKPPSKAKDESLRQIFGGVREAFRQRGLKRLLVVGLPMSGATTVAGAWGAPYLMHVHGVDELWRGKILLIMAVSAMFGHVIYGQLARRFNTLKGIIIFGGCLGVMASGVMAIMTKPPLLLVILLFCLIGLASAYPSIVHAHARGLVPAHLIGRGVSVTNMGIMVAVATVQLGFGWIVGLFAAVDGAPPEHAYRAAFAAQATAALICLLIYAPVRDIKPRG